MVSIRKALTLTIYCPAEVLSLPMMMATYQIHPRLKKYLRLFARLYTAGQGFIGLLDDAGLGLRQYVVTTNGEKWFLAPFLVAASSLGYSSLTRYGDVLNGALPAEEDTVVEPSVMIEGGVWEMWYRYGGWTGHPRIAYATSPEGKT